MGIRAKDRMIAGLAGTALLGASAFLASGCSDHPDAIASEFYIRLAARDIDAMARVVCEDERVVFQESVAFLQVVSDAGEVDLQDFKARTERSDGTSVMLRVSGRFVSAELGEMPTSGRMELLREGGAWCISGERDDFRAINDIAGDLFSLLIRGGISGDAGFFPEDPRPIPVEVVTPSPAAPPEVGGEVVTTDSGLQYVEIEIGTGAMPMPEQTVLVHYTMWVKAGGDLIHSSVGREPFEFVLGGGAVTAGNIYPLSPVGCAPEQSARRIR